MHVFFIPSKLTVPSSLAGEESGQSQSSTPNTALRGVVFGEWKKPKARHMALLKKTMKKGDETTENGLSPFECRSCSPARLEM